MIRNLLIVLIVSLLSSCVSTSLTKEPIEDVAATKEYQQNEKAQRAYKAISKLAPNSVEAKIASLALIRINQSFKEES